MGLILSSVVDASHADVLAWHRRPGAITRLLPPWQPVCVVRKAPSVRFIPLPPRRRRSR